MNVRRCVLPLETAAFHRTRFFSTQPAFSIPIPPLPKLISPQPPTPPPQNPSSAHSEFTHISKILYDPALKPGPELEEALTALQINPIPNLLLDIFNHFDSTPKPLFTLFNWARNRPDYQFSIAVFNAMVNSLAKAREFDSAWSLILHQIKEDHKRPDIDTFRIMIRRYARAGLSFAAIRTFEYASNLEFFHNLDPENNLFDTLIDSLCKEGHVRIASKYCDERKAKNPSWVTPVRTYNILLHGWFKSRKPKNAERLWNQMKREGIKPTVVTYGTLIEGFCRNREVDVAMELVTEMKASGIEPNAIVYNSIIDALGEAGRFKEALGMLERFSILETGPTIYTYNSLVKGFCKAGDMVEASKILRMMIDDKCLPTSMTYGYFFKHFAKAGKIKVGLSLYNKLIEAGYEPDRVTYHLLVKMLSREGEVGPTIQILGEMRARGFDLDLAASTMLIHLLWRMHRYDEAVFEFEDMFRRGIVPQHVTYVRMCDDLERRGMMETAEKLRGLMGSVRRSTKLPDTYRGSGNASSERRKSILKRAENMSDVLKTCRSPREIVRRGYGPENDVVKAQKLIENMQKKVDLR
ncbi:hypothetical protein CASFOL_007277 [Castilleja foliolosa]|uniref:Pentatricopeptide repeat-containing protein n=1 Tax=Castilleja foliolosa TaxID=1961234 RepID=A0ABD3ECL5_9LAMI